MQDSERENSARGLRYLRGRESVIYFSIFFIIHFVVAVYYKEAVGVELISGSPGSKVDSVWHVLPYDLLKNDMLSSIWNLHSQPPLYNLYVGALLKLCDTSFLSCRHYINILLGSILSGMLFGIIVNFTGNRKFSFYISMILALNSALILYEAFMLYTIQIAFLVVACIYFLSMYQERGSQICAIIFVVAVNVLILTRGVYHPAILIVVMFFVYMMSNERRWRILLISLCISMLSLGWYAKNYYKFGFFGASSWFGMNLWKIVAYDYSDEELAELVQTKVLDRIVVENQAFTLPSRYERFGYSKTSDVKALSNNDYNNINIPDICKLYLHNSIKLILYDPWRYIKTVRTAYCIYVLPSSQYQLLIMNIGRIMAHDNIYYYVLQGGGAFLFVVFPISMILYLFIPIRCCGFSRERLADFVRSDGAMLFTAFLILYNAFICCTIECAENNRFKFEIEQMLWAFIAGVAFRYARLLRGGRLGDWAVRTGFPATDGRASSRGQGV